MAGRLIPWSCAGACRCAEAESGRTRRDLEALSRALPELKESRSRVLGVSPLKLEELKRLQAERGLRFPLLHDDPEGAAVAHGELPQAPSTS